MAAVAEVVLALGSNLGDRAANLRRAIIYLEREGVSVERVSSAWDTPPFPAGQPRFLNAAIVGRTGLGPEALLELVKRGERDLGRRETWHWGPRVIDIDILFYDAMQIETPSLVIPHPQISGRAFVLAPLAEVWEGPLPVLGATAGELLDRVDASDVKRLPGGLLLPSPAGLAAATGAVARGFVQARNVR